MAISIWDKPAELKLTPLPFEALMQAGLMKEKQYSEGEALEGSLNDELAKIGSIDIDTPDKIAELQKYKQGINTIVDKYKGDYGAMSSAFKQLQKDFNYNKNYGKLSGIINRYNKRVESVNAKVEANKEWIKSNGERGMSPEDVDAAQKAEDANQAPLTQNLRLGTWTGYRAEDPRNSINYNTVALKYSDKITPEVLRLEAKNRGLHDAGYGYLKSDDGTIKISPANFRAQVIADAMKNDEVVKNYTAWRNRITGTNDKISQIVGSPDNNFTGIDLESGLAISRNPKIANTLFDELYHKPIYDAARSIGSLTRVYEENLKTDYHLNEIAKEQRAAQKEAANQPYEYAMAGSSNSIKDLTGLSSDDFSVIPVGTKVNTAPLINPDGSISINALRSPSGQNLNIKTVTTPTPKVDANNFQGVERNGFTNLLRTLAYMKPNDQYVQDVYNKYKNGEKLTNQEMLDTYPHVQKIAEAANKLSMANTNVSNIIDNKERAAINQLLGTKGDEVVTVKQLGTGNIGNLEIYDVANHKTINASQLKANHIMNPDSQVSIQGKINGPNAYSILTGNKKYANGYQLFIDGKEYIIEAPLEWKDPKMAIPALMKQNEAANYAAVVQPGVVLAENFEGIDYDYKFTEDPKNADQGLYTVNIKPVKDESAAAKSYREAVLNTPLPSAKDVTGILLEYYKIINTPTK